MTEFNFVTANDIHISDHAPRSRIDNFKVAILGKIDQMRQACSKLKADAALIAGDLFNLKEPARNSHGLNRDLVAVFNKFPCPIYMIEGNHDLTANRLDSIKDQPLGVLFEDHTLIQLREKVIEKNKIKVSLVGVPYIENLDLNTLVIPPKGDCVSQICIMHLYAGLKGGKFFQNRIYGYDELAKLGADVYVLGHYHLDQGVYEQDGKRFINLGFMTRGTLAEDDIQHRPQIGLIKIVVDDTMIPKYTIMSYALELLQRAPFLIWRKRKRRSRRTRRFRNSSTRYPLKS